MYWVGDAHVVIPQWCGGTLAHPNVGDHGLGWPQFRDMLLVSDVATDDTPEDTLPTVAERMVPGNDVTPAASVGVVSAACQGDPACALRTSNKVSTWGAVLGKAEAEPRTE